MLVFEYDSALASFVNTLLCVNVHYSFFDAISCNLCGVAIFMIKFR